MLYVHTVSWNQGTTQGVMEPSLYRAGSEHCAIVTVVYRVPLPFRTQNLKNSVCLDSLQFAVLRRTLLVYVLLVLVTPRLVDWVSDTVI